LQPDDLGLMDRDRTEDLPQNHQQQNRGHRHEGEALVNTDLEQQRLVVNQQPEGLVGKVNPQQGDDGIQAGDPPGAAVQRTASPLRRLAKRGFADRQAG
jgi:hypothetical protein